MLRRLSPLLFLAFLAAGAPPAKDDELTWHWDRDSLGCDLEQQLTALTWTPITVGRNPGTDETTISFKVRSSKFWKGYYPGGQVILSTGVTVPADVQVYSAPNRSYELLARVTDPAFLKALAGASTIAIAHESFGKFEVPVKDLAPAATALRNCENAKLKEWGVDSASLWALQSRPVPIGPLQELFTSFDYPGVGITKFKEANITAKLEVGEDGGVRSCTWLGPPEYPQFGETICKGLKEKAHFRPARDADGRPVSAPYVTTAKFRMGRW
jgi:hypothetical protein